jgi:hypothetical protein
MMIKTLWHYGWQIGAVGLSIALLFLMIGCSWIGYEVKIACEEAKRYKEGDCVEALTAVVDDEKMGFWERNRAIWALGQLGDERALLVFEKHYTGKIPEREPLGELISQYELRKAIRLAEGGVNLSAWVWRE